MAKKWYEDGGYENIKMADCFLSDIIIYIL